jgi:hypothetical protein
MPEIKKCHVEPLSIIWENYHLKDNVDILKSCFIGVFVTVILILSLVAIFLVSIHMTGLIDSNLVNVATNDDKNFN